MGTAAIVVGIASLLASIVTGGINYYNTQKTNEQMQANARENADIAQRNSKELLDYNSPSYQMNRLIGAGLNPNLAYDNLDSGVPTGPQPETPALKAPQLSSDIGVDDALKVAQIERLHAASQNETELTSAQVDSLYKHIEVQEATKRSLYAQADATSQSILESKARVQFLNQSTREKIYDTFYKQSTVGMRVEQMAVDLDVSKTKAVYVDRYMAATCLGLENQAKMYLSQAHLNSMQSAVCSQLSSIYGFQSQLLSQDVASSHTPINTNGGFIPNTTLGLYTRRNQLSAENVKYSLIQTQNDLLSRFGGSEHVANIVLKWSNAFESISNGISNFLPLKTKTVSPAGVSRTTTSHFSTP